MTTEHLAAWYFRLNGFFTITNFVLHPSRRGPQRTDADVVGVRFPYRSEFPEAPSGDENEFTRIANRPYLVIAEVKRGLCQLNGPWTNTDKQNIHAVLRDLGPFPAKRIEGAAWALYRQGVFDRDQMYCSLFCVGDAADLDIDDIFGPDARQMERGHSGSSTRRPAISRKAFFEFTPETLPSGPE